MFLTLAVVIYSRWRLCVSDVDNVLGFALGAMFVNRTFDGHSKPEAEAMIKVTKERSLENAGSKEMGWRWCTLIL